MSSCLLVVALAAEARPLIDHFGLKLLCQKPYRSYGNDTLQLVETGIGKLTAAAATAASLVTMSHTRPPICLNIGIAGSAEPIGSLHVAHRVIDRSSGKIWYPQLTGVFHGSARTTTTLPQNLTVETVDQPETDYLRLHAFDMEAAGFVAAATRFTSLEFVHCLKVISDNPQSSLSNVNSDCITRLVAAHTNTIEAVINSLSTLNQLLPDQSDIRALTEEICMQTRFTRTRREKLYRLLVRLKSQQHHLPTASELIDYTQADPLLQHLQKQADNYIRHY